MYKIIFDHNVIAEVTLKGQKPLKAQFKKKAIITAKNDTELQRKIVKYAIETQMESAKTFSKIGLNKI